MKQDVSKARTRKTKNREKQATRKARKFSTEENPLIGIAICAVLWLLTFFLIGLEHFLKPDISMGEVLFLAGDGVFALVSLFGAGLFLNLTRPETCRRNSRIGLLALSVLLTLIPAKGLLFFREFIGPIPSEVLLFLLPFAIAPLLITILSDSVHAIAAGVWSTLIIALMAARTVPQINEVILPLMITGMIVTVIAAQTSREAKTRSKVFRTASTIGFAEIVCVLGLTAFRWQSINITMVIHMAGACMTSALFSALLVLLITPLFETMFNITTDMTLLELSDLSHPLLQKLAIEAPGTYHHSLVVAILSQAAAEEIGANPLLARVSAYFHDIGKLTKPGLFAENIHMQDNPHDRLSPSMSTLVITAHVKEGLSLAFLHKLPTAIKKAIQEHHGTSILSFFHHKAKEQLELQIDDQQKNQANGRRSIEEGSFRYSGPKPSSRESAIICLADSVEAASRSMEKPTPAHIKDLVSEIVTQRLLDGQLDDSTLTLTEINRIKKSFVFTLTNMMHARMPYPKDENTDKQQPKNQKDRQKQAPSGSSQSSENSETS